MLAGLGQYIDSRAAGYCVLIFPEYSVNLYMSSTLPHESPSAQAGAHVAGAKCDGMPVWLIPTASTRDATQQAAHPRCASPEEQGSALKKMRNLARRIERVRKQELRAKKEILETCATRAAFVSTELALRVITARGALLEEKFKSLERCVFKEQGHASVGLGQPTVEGENGATLLAVRSEPPQPQPQPRVASSEPDPCPRSAAALCAHDSSTAVASWATQEHLQDEIELASLGEGAARRRWFAAFLSSMYSACGADETFGKPTHEATLDKR